MRNSVKTLAFIIIAGFLSITSAAQLKLPVINGIGSDIKKVLQDFPNQFNNLKGEMLVQNPQSTDYACNFKVNGAEESSVTQYSSKKYAIASWQTVMLTTDDFDEARKIFRSLFNQLNNLSTQMTGGAVLHFKGKYEQPVEEKKFSSVIFSTENKNTSFEKLKIELSMQYELLEWKVRVLVYEKEREDNERGSVEEN